MRENVEKLLQSELSLYRIAKDTGIPENTVRRLKKGTTSIDKMRFEVIEELNNYYIRTFVLKEL